MSSISYLVTVFNKALCLPKLFEGLKNQQGDFAREFIFVDDGSTDGSFDILMEMAYELGGKVITQHSQGPSCALNTGLKHAKNEWCFLVDGDDFLYPEASSILLQLTEQYPNAVIFKGADTNHLIKDKKKTYSNKVTHIKDAFTKSIKSYSAGKSLVNTNVAQKVGGCDERVLTPDYLLALRMALHGEFVQIDKLISTNIDAGQHRLSFNKLRENRDSALTRFLFIKDNLHIPYSNKYSALQYHLCKTWKWYFRKTFNLFSKHLARYLYTRIYHKNLSDELILRWLKESLLVYS